MDDIKLTLMSSDEFLKLHNPASKSRFKLSPHHIELWKLKNSGCTLGQIKSFLKINGIESSINKLSYYFLNNSENNVLINSKSDSPQITKPAASSIPTTSTINSPARQTTQPNISRKVNSPEELRKIMYAPVDFKAIIKAAKDIEDAEKAAKLLNK